MRVCERAQLPPGWNAVRHVSVKSKYCSYVGPAGEKATSKWQAWQAFYLANPAAPSQRTRAARACGMLAGLPSFADMPEALAEPVDMSDEEGDAGWP